MQWYTLLGVQWYTLLGVQWYTLLEVRWYTPLEVRWYTSLGVPVYTSYRVRVHTLLGTEVLPRSVQRDCPERCRGTVPLGVQLHISPAFAPQTRIKTSETKPLSVEPIRDS